MATKTSKPKTEPVNKAFQPGTPLGGPSGTPQPMGAPQAMNADQQQFANKTAAQRVYPSLKP